MTTAQKQEYRDCIPLLIVALIIGVLIFPGCSSIEHAIPEILPTARYCQEVSYRRTNDDVSIVAQCKAPFGGM